MRTKKWKGKPFVKWCESDLKDERRIHYDLQGIMDGKERREFFTSEQKVEPIFLFRLRQSVLMEEPVLKNNEWYVKLYYLVKIEKNKANGGN